MRTLGNIVAGPAENRSESGPPGKPNGGRLAQNRRTPFRILLASGNAKERTSWRGMLEDPNYAVSEAENGATALKAMLMDEADLVVAAVTMSKLDALELLRAARDIKRAPPIIVVALGHSEINQVYLKTARLLGAAATYMQPFDATEFATGVQNVLKAKTA